MFIAYHATPDSNVNSILSYGLVPSIVFEGDEFSAIYMANDIEKVKDYAKQAYSMGVSSEKQWAVIKIQYDEFPGEVYPDLLWGLPGVHYVKVPIPPEHLEFIESFSVAGNPATPTVTLYHGTNKEVAARALREGLQPQPGVETDFPSTYLAYDPLEAAKYGEVVLRVELPKEELRYTQETIPGYMRTTYPIESKYVSVYSGSTTTAAGTCYPDAWRYVARHTEDNPVLAHGTIVGLYGRMNHAWVELPDGTVWDPSSQAKMPIEKYYSLVDPIVDDRYTADEAMHMLSVGKHGPWNAEERMKWIGR